MSGQRPQGVFGHEADADAHGQVGLLLCGILGIYFGAGAQTMNLHEIAALHNIPLSQQYIWFPMVFVGFGVLGALFPFHTWSPDGHASAPTAVSMLHAGGADEARRIRLFPRGDVPAAPRRRTS